MGLGAALEEQLYEGGRLVNPAYLHYALPRAADVPPIRVLLLGHPDPRAPYGVKGVGEISMVPVAPAVANAVAHAVGIRVRELPITPDKVLGALRAGGPTPSLSRVAAAGALVDRLDAVGVSAGSTRCWTAGAPAPPARCRLPGSPACIAPRWWPRPWRRSAEIGRRWP